VPLVKSITSDTIIFQLTDEDIEEALSRRATTKKDRYSGGYLGCDPISVALEKIGKYRGVYVGWLAVSAYKGPERHDYQVISTQEVYDVITSFDWHVDPIPLHTIELFFQGVVTKSVPSARKVTKNEKIILSRHGQYIP